MPSQLVPKPSPTVTLLMPAFNEAARIGVVLAEIKNLTWLKQIIVIDDASTDQTAAIVKDKFPQVKLLKLTKNQGKSTAIKLAAVEVTTDWILLLDADLWGFEAKFLTAAWQKLQTNQHLSQLILALTTDPPIWQKLKLNIVMSGQRFIQTKLLKEFFKQHTPQNYDLEILFTDWTLCQQLAVGWLPFKVFNYTKLQKWPWWQALPKSLSFYGKWLQLKRLKILFNQIIRLNNQLN